LSRVQTSVFSLNRTDASSDMSTNPQPRTYSCRASMASNSSCVATGMLSSSESRPMTVFLAGGVPQATSPTMYG